ncbi:MAG: dihydrofolate reductase family protein [Cyclobacteriaceae bacterium]
MGSRTYEHALALSRDHGWAYGKPTVVLTPGVCRRQTSMSSSTAVFRRLVNEQLRPRFGHVWVAGGAITASEFICLQLVDELRISILPVLLGGGRSFLSPQHWRIRSPRAVACRNGMVELRYLRVGEEPPMLSLAADIMDT